MIPTGRALRRAGHTSGVVGDDCVHESWHDDSEGRHSREVKGRCHRVRAQSFVVAEPCRTGTGASEEKEGSRSRT